MQIEYHISLDSVVTLVGFLGIIIANYFGVIRRVDAHSYRLKSIEDDVTDLKKGRGLMLEYWPQSVQRCMGYIGRAHHPVE